MTPAGSRRQEDRSKWSCPFPESAIEQQLLLLPGRCRLDRLQYSRPRFGKFGWSALDLLWAGHQ